MFWMLRTVTTAIMKSLPRKARSATTEKMTTATDKKTSKVPSMDPCFMLTVMVMDMAMSLSPWRRVASPMDMCLIPPIATTTTKIPLLVPLRYAIVKTMIVMAPSMKTPVFNIIWTQTKTDMVMPPKVSNRARSLVDTYPQQLRWVHRWGRCC